MKHSPRPATPTRGFRSDAQDSRGLRAGSRVAEIGLNPTVVRFFEAVMSVEIFPEFFNGEEVLQLLRINAKFPRQTLLRLRRAGLPATKVLGRFLYPKGAVIAFLQSLSGANE